MYLLFAIAYLFTAWHIPPRTPLSTIINISAYVNNSHSTFVFFKHVRHAFPAAEKNEQDLAHKFPDTSFWNFWICLQATGYHSAHTGHNIDQHFVILNLARLSWRVINQRLCCSPLLGCCEIPSLWVMKFHWTFLSDPLSIYYRMSAVVWASFLPSPF